MYVLLSIFNSNVETGGVFSVQLFWSVPVSTAVTFSVSTFSYDNVINVKK